MQTFIPYADFAASARCLDMKRLGKQRVEAYQILLILRDTSKTAPWKNHPACRMWRGHEQALIPYGLAMCDEWLRRNYQDHVRERLLELAGCAFKPSPRGQVTLPGFDSPKWLGDERLHSSHRAALLFKVERELHVARIIWRRDDHPRVVNANKAYEWYASRGWSEAPSLNYWWPEESKASKKIAERLALKSDAVVSHRTLKSDAVVSHRTLLNDYEPRVLFE